MSIRLSVNVNKVATLRNSRGGEIPDLIRASRACVAAGAAGITVHPREDGRHIRNADVHTLHHAFASEWGEALEFNIEGDPRPEWLDLVCEVRPQQATLVPVRPGEITSEAGWRPATDTRAVSDATQRLKRAGIRVSVFIDADERAARFARECGADRVELYTEPFAKAWTRGPTEARASFARYVRAAEAAHAEGLGINAGHDLDVANLRLFATLPHLDEVSIGHAIWSEALFAGIAPVLEQYQQVLRAGAARAE
jgi:pyridoxine 5-phosphate synthase